MKHKTPAPLSVAAPTVVPAAGPASAPGATAGIVRDAAASRSPAWQSLTYRFVRAVKRGPVPKGFLERDLGWERARINRLYARECEPTLEEATDLAEYLQVHYPRDPLTRDLETALTIVQHERAGA
jgi:hypothetical protein